MTPASLIRRVEQLEATVQRQAQLIGALGGREARGTAMRWAYLAKTIRVGADYPTGTANTFGLRFLDREFTATQGSQAVTEKPRSASKQAIGRTINGQWVLEGEVVVVFPAPPPPNTTGKGRWWIVAQPYYYGKLTTSLAANGSGSMTVWQPTATGWEATGFSIPVWDWFLRFASLGTTLPIGTGLRVDWVTNPLDASKSRFVVSESSCLPDDLFA